MLVKVLAIQSRLGQRLSLAAKIQIFKQRPDFVCLPEYWLVDESTVDHQRAAIIAPEAIEYLTRLSDELGTCLIAGSIIEAAGDQLYNTCLVINRGEILGRYRKRFPFGGELLNGVSAGSGNLIVEVDGVRVAVMICSDVFHPELYAELAEQNVDLIFIPTASPFRSDDTIPDKRARDRTYFWEGAKTSGAYLVKVCGVGTLFGRPQQGRSLMAAPWSILSRVGYDEESRERILSETLDIDELRDFRQKQHQNASREQAMNAERPSVSRP